MTGCLVPTGDCRHRVAQPGNRERDREHEDQGADSRHDRPEPDSGRPQHPGPRAGQPLSGLEHRRQPGVAVRDSGELVPAQPERPGQLPGQECRVGEEPGERGRPAHRPFPDLGQAVAGRNNEVARCAERAADRLLVATVRFLHLSRSTFQAMSCVTASPFGCGCPQTSISRTARSEDMPRAV